jgi:hypothetical protein
MEIFNSKSANAWILLLNFSVNLSSKCKYVVIILLNCNGLARIDLMEAESISV